MKVLIAIPALDVVATDFALSLASMLTSRAYDKKLRREVDVAVACCRGTIIPHSRNRLAQQALDIGASHIFFLDSDMAFPPDTLSRLIGHHVPIVGADYVRRVEPHPLNGNPAPNYREDRRGVLAPMLTLPFGCILIKTSVLSDLERPWFSYREGVTAEDALSEDTFFCNQARRAGHTIWCDLALTQEVGHVGNFIFRPKDRQTL